MSALGGDGPTYSFWGQTLSTQTNVVSMLSSDDTFAFAQRGEVEARRGAIFTLVYALSVQTGPNSWAEREVEEMIKSTGERLK